MFKSIFLPANSRDIWCDFQEKRMGKFRLGYVPGKERSNSSNNNWLNSYSISSQATLCNTCAKYRLLLYEEPHGGFFKSYMVLAVAKNPAFLIRCRIVTCTCLNFSLLKLCSVFTDITVHCLRYILQGNHYQGELSIYTQLSKMFLWEKTSRQLQISQQRNLKWNSEV